MRWIGGFLQITTGLAYFFSVGALSAFELWKRRNEDVSRLDKLLLWGLIAMALSCGPHHLDVGTHMLLYGHPASPLDTSAILIALPFGVAWTWFRLGQVFPHQHPESRPWWYPAADWRLPSSSHIPMNALSGLVGYCVAVVLTSSMLVFTSQDLDLAVNHPETYVPQMVLLGLYVGVGYVLWTTLMRNARRPDGYWSLASMSLAIIFPTCAITHFTYGAAVARGAYPVLDYHATIFDWYGIPAAAFFLWITYRRRYYIPPLNLKIDQLLVRSSHD